MKAEFNLNNNKQFVIQTEKLCKSYRINDSPKEKLWQLIFSGHEKTAKKFTALDKLDLDVNHGEVLGIVGVNGAGKSTLLQLIAGTLTPTSGSLKTNGRVAAILELGAGFNPEFTGRENIILNAATLGLTKSEVDTRLNSIIEFSGIGIHIDLPVKTYSSGMLVRLAFSVATSVNADILIIDEALSVGDGAFRRKSFDRIMEIKNQGSTILFCSHVLFHIETFCDRAIWLHAGKVQKVGLPIDVLPLYQDFLDAYEKNPAINPEDLAENQPKLEYDNNLPLSKALYPNREADLPSLQEARFDWITVSMDGNEGKNLHGFSGISKLEVNFSFASDPALPCPTAALVISNENGRILGSTMSQRQCVLTRDLKGKGLGYVSIDKIGMNRGNYRLGVYLFCERGLHGYAMIDPVTNFSLENIGTEQGLILLASSWR